jgi:hypothetical protein
VVNIPLEKLNPSGRLEDNFLWFSGSSSNLAGMTPKTKKIILISGGVVVLGFVFFWWKSRQAAAAAGTLPGSAAGTTPGSAAAAASTTPTGSVASPAGTPVSGTPAVTGGPAGGSSAALPAGFQTWFNSLGPANQKHMSSMLPTMPQADITFIDNQVTKNLWGQKSVEAQWNAFVSKYGLPVNGSFSQFSGGL